MAPRGPPFDFDLNEPPPEDDGAIGASPARAPEPVREPSPSDLLPPLPHETLPSPQHEDPLPPPGHDPLRRPVPESLPRDPLPSPAPEPSPRDPPHLPSPVLDLEAPLSPLDDDDYDYDEADLPPPPPLPPFGLPVAAAPALSSSSVDTPRAVPAPPSRRGGRTSREPFGDAARLSSPEDPALRGPSRAASGAAPPRRSRSRRHSYGPRDGGAISKQRRVDCYDEDARSSRSGSRRSEPGSPRRHERSELAFPPLWGSPDDGRQSPEKDDINGGYHQRGEAPPAFRPSSRPRGGDNPYNGRRGQAQEPPKIGGYQHGGAHGGDGSSGERQSPSRQPVSGGAYRQRKKPRDQPYHPYARDGGALDRSGGGGGQAWRAPA
ncbi:formin-like protein 20 [Panicum virgatum]|uniref:formin-like protein 20 n=1 Tax=Panicum virgatum TaxID=38727 RepID=UPI0019D5CBA8|nr:formin-like protein 20 [Panicum virgatum]